MKTQIIILGVNLLNDFRAGSIRVRNLFETIIDNNNYNVINILQHKEIRECEVLYAPNTIIIQKTGLLKYFIICRLLSKLKHENQRTLIYNYGSVNNYNFLIIIWAKLISIQIVFDIVENNHVAIDLKSGLSWVKRKFTGFCEKRLYIFANKTFAISTNLFRLTSAFSKNRYPVIYLPISVRLNEWENSSNRHNSPKQIIFYGGSFGQKDGLKYLLEAFQNISNEFPEIELHLSGTGAARHINSVMDMINNLKCKEKVLMLGALSRQKYIEALLQSDIVCMTRINSDFANYGFPLKLGEYMAAGKPIIASKVSDVEFYLEHKTDAWIVTPESSLEIEQGIRFLLENPDVGQKMGINARKKVETYFNSKNIGKQFEQEIQALL